MGEDPGDHGGLGDHGDDPHKPLAPGQVSGSTSRIVFDAEDVRDRLSKLLADDDLRRYIL